MLLRIYNEQLCLVRGYSWLFRDYFVAINGPWLSFVAIFMICGYFVAIFSIFVAISLLF